MDQRNQQIDLSSLTVEQKISLLDLIEEKEKRLREKADVYSPNSGQITVHQSAAPERWVFAGNGSGKSALAANEAIWALEGYNPYLKAFTKVPCRVIVVLDHPEKVGDQWVPELQKWKTLKPEQLNKRGKPYISQIVLDNGSELLFMFHQQDPLIFESIESDWIIFDEPPPRAIYIALKRSLRKKGSRPRVLGVGTPITAAWLRKEIADPVSKGELPGVECFRFGTRVNERNLAEGYIQTFSRALTEKEKRVRLDGEFFDLEGLALAHLIDPTVHYIERPEHWDTSNPCVVVMDPHPSKAHHAILLSCDRDGYLYIVDEYKEKAIARRFMKALIERGWFTDYKVIDIVYDSLGNAEMTSGEGFLSFGQVINQELEKAALGRARATTWSDKDDESFIERIRDVLDIPDEPNNYGQRVPKLRVFRHCVGSRSDLENVQWAKARGSVENKPKLDISDKDFLSCLKYGLASNLSYAKTKTQIWRHAEPVKTYGQRAQPKTLAAVIAKMTIAPRKGKRGF